MQTAANVARWFLGRNQEDYLLGDSEFLTNLKLQKLLYYAQGCYLGLYGKPLFADDLYAWKHGPVVPSIYHEYEQYKGEGITNFIAPTAITAEEYTVLEWVWENFGQYSAWKLRNMSHEETPWCTTKLKDVISKEYIESYFAQNYVTDDSETGEA